MLASMSFLLLFPKDSPWMLNISDSLGGPQGRQMTHRNTAVWTELQGLKPSTKLKPSLKTMS